MEVVQILVDLIDLSDKSCPCISETLIREHCISIAQKLCFAAKISCKRRWCKISSRSKAQNKATVRVRYLFGVICDANILAVVLVSEFISLRSVLDGEGK